MRESRCCGVQVRRTDIRIDWASVAADAPATKPLPDEIAAEIADAAAALLGTADSVRADETATDATAIEPKESDASTRPTAPVESTDTAPADEAPSTVPADDADTVDPPADLATPITDALAELRAAFDAALAELRAAFADAVDLGPPAAPTGNGSAHDKFMAIYNHLLGLPAAMDEGV